MSPIHKDGAKSMLNNYRPIYVPSGVAKIIERAIFNQFYAYLVINNLLNKYQSGFRPRHSTVTALLQSWTKVLGTASKYDKCSLIALFSTL